jgi:hypothetical protein
MTRSSVICILEHRLLDGDAFEGLSVDLNPCVVVVKKADWKSLVKREASPILWEGAYRCLPWGPKGS